MKKIRHILIILILFSFIIAISQARAIEIPNPAEALQEKTGISPDKITDVEEIKNKYLKQEWGKILQKNKYLSPIIGFLDSIFTLLDPLFKIILGINYSLSWAFTFAIITWIILFAFIYPPTTAFFNNKLLSLASSFVIVSLIGITGVIKKTVDILVLIIKKPSILWISLIISLIILCLFSLLGKTMKSYIKKYKEIAAKEKEKEDREILHLEAEMAKEKMKNL
ncbi:MAG: hypothetical protein AABW65_02095 [Nanoarchaeota archaeon]